MVILRFSLALAAPGCLHLLLESVSPKAPYLLENRTPHPFQYRQAGIGKAPSCSHVKMAGCLGSSACLCSSGVCMTWLLHIKQRLSACCALVLL